MSFIFSLYNPDYDSDFEKLNFEWLEKYFYIEDYDRLILGDPKKHIIDKGGQILFALIDSKVVGTVALMYRDKGVYELTKMAVNGQYQGLRIGQKLMYACIDYAGKHGWSRLFLDSNTKLNPAIALYKKVGFREIPVLKDSPYERCNIRMELHI